MDDPNPRARQLVQSNVTGKIRKNSMNISKKKTTNNFFFL